ncbi:uncharacterized protein SPSC_03318 [Sporisorium scitamineum]|uniref:Uncharacterized protein n=1 Tax=Sporisorium scitamineum TaxID=49012 RepID=A0A127ZF54_9BASI|nr:uncharacterized protein SPSC_03318 [Sporisorium scitamineum]
MDISPNFQRGPALDQCRESVIEWLSQEAAVRKLTDTVGWTSLRGLRLSRNRCCSAASLRPQVGQGRSSASNCNFKNLFHIEIKALDECGSSSAQARIQVGVAEPSKSNKRRFHRGNQHKSPFLTTRSLIPPVVTFDCSHRIKAFSMNGWRQPTFICVRNGACGAASRNCILSGRGDAWLRRLYLGDSTVVVVGHLSLVQNGMIDLAPWPAARSLTRGNAVANKTSDWPTWSGPVESTNDRAVPDNAALYLIASGAL